MNIIKWPDSALSTKALECNADGINASLAHARDMIATMHSNGGCGLAAPQVGINERIIVLNTIASGGQLDDVIMINPVIGKRSNDSVSAKEGCLSIPGIRVSVPRSSTVELSFIDSNGENQIRDFTGFDARAIQHEIDHLEGLTLWDAITPETRRRAKKKFDKLRKQTP